LALVCTIKHFAYYLYGRKFTAFTDHKPLEQLITSDCLNTCLGRMAYKLQHWMVEIQHLPGQENIRPILFRGKSDQEEDCRPRIMKIRLSVSPRGIWQQERDIVKKEV